MISQVGHMGKVTTAIMQNLTMHLKFKLEVVMVSNGYNMGMTLICLPQVKHQCSCMLSSSSSAYFAPLKSPYVSRQYFVAEHLFGHNFIHDGSPILYNYKCHIISCSFETTVYCP